MFDGERSLRLGRDTGADSIAVHNVRAGRVVACLHQQSRGKRTYQTFSSQLMQAPCCVQAASVSACLVQCHFTCFLASPSICQRAYLPAHLPTCRS